MRINKYILGLLLFTGVVVSLLFVAVKSSWMYSKIENEFQSITGYKIDLRENASVRGVFPNVTVSFPTIVIKSLDGAGGLSRLRLSNAEASFPLTSIGGQLLHNVVLDVGSMTAIVDADAVPNKDVQASTYSEIDLQSRVQQAVPFLTDANLAATVREIVIISRSDGGAASTYKLLDNRIKLDSMQMDIQGHAVSTKHPSHAYEIAVDISSSKKKLAGNVMAAIDMHGEEQQLTLDTDYQIINNNVYFQHINIIGPELSISGEVNAKVQSRFQDNNSNISAQFNVHRLELSQERTLRYLSSQNKHHNEPLFKDTRLDLFEHLDLDLKLTLGAVRLNNQPIVSGDFVVTARDNKFSLNSNQLVFLGGAGNLNISGTPVDGRHEVSISSYLNDAQLSRLQITNDNQLLFRKGQADLKVSLKAAGNSASSLARSLKGYFMLASHDVEISQRYARDLDRGVLSVVVDNIDRFRRKSKSVSATTAEKGSLPVKCASVKLIINDGYLEVINGLVAELPDNTLLSSGYIDLHSEKMGFAFRTRKKKILDWSALSLIRFVELGGTLTQPKIMLDRKELMKQGLLTTTSVLVGARPPLVYQLAETGLDSLNSIACLPQLTNE